MPQSFVLEDLYLAGRYPWPGDPKARKGRLVELEAWNTGGLGADEKWHPAPRVVISEPVVKKGKLDTREAMRVLRREQYGAVRRCYDPELREHPTLDGRTVLSLSVARGGLVTSARPVKGGVPDPRTHKTAMPNRKVVACLAGAMKGATLPAPRKAPAVLLVAIDVWPGDAPLPEREAMPRQGSLDLAAASDVVRGLRPELDACVVPARTRHPGLWGRLALRVDVTSEGRAGEVAETESAFADPEVRRCVARVLEGASWPRPSGDARIVVPLRIGAPP